MEELFANISDAVKKRANTMFQIAMRQKNIVSMVNTLNEYTNSCQDQEERKFVEFLFNLKMEQVKNGNIHDKR